MIEGMGCSYRTQPVRTSARTGPWDVIFAPGSKGATRGEIVGALKLAFILSIIRAAGGTHCPRGSKGRQRSAKDTQPQKETGL
jgi:hypothetical protein